MNLLEEKDLSDKVRHVSIKDGDGSGYDILSFFQDGKEKYIEVKSTTMSIEAPFYLSKNELGFLKEHVENYFLYRISIANNIPQIEAYDSAKILEKAEITPVQYMVQMKS